ncbi:hypothetical protein H257_08838 [Aphanomyces astaci]|uniref:DDE Tnp4 domain-containing protein n=1 Tax=Aphanomyces astaci TaxID=112090 RepID=W4GEB8_APHAT|nr:hypothetical protein H257_08838 [Aphanomyces astaci]ETV77419.1 hypothetical protein H257_08838 [Aphanomyces astaci]|eukprot:XP_009833206.1 hypothetical protein H257_08838 [Aphanomyces astaci]
MRLRPVKPIVSYNNFDRDMHNATAVHKFRFTIEQIRVLAVALRLPAFLSTSISDQVESLEALAILCRRLAEPCRLFTIADEFGRSVEACSRIDRNCSVQDLERCDPLSGSLAQTYAGAIESKSGLRGLRTCVAFIDGTKQYISRPSAEGQEHENLQRSVYNGHLRRHCLNWQGITVPDGIIISMYVPVVGRRHDSTMFSMSRIWRG